MERIIAELERLESEEGFLFDLRYRVFDLEKGEKYFKVLKRIDLGDAQYIDRRLARLLWEIPLFLEQRVQDFEENQVLPEKDLVELRQLCNRISGQIESIFNDEN